MPDPTKLTAAFIKSGTYRRDGLTVYGAVDPARAALLVMNLQNAWLAPGAPFSPPGDTSTRAILPAIHRLAGRVRQGGGHVFWFRTTTGAPGSRDYWSTYFDNFVGPDKRADAVAALLPDSPWHELSPEVERRATDRVFDKHRFSAFLRNSYDLERLLRAMALDTVIVAGTATNVCCESTVRDAMMRDFRTYMPHDAVAAPRANAHQAGLRSVMQGFADIRPVDEILPEGEEGTS
jgi:ureidoacrylate peracid hydrolase